MAGYMASLGSILGMNSDQTQGSIGLGIGGVGLGLDIMGMLQANKAAGEEASISIDEANTEMKMNDVRRQMMTLDTNRKMIEAARNAQLAQARGRAAAVNQGGSVMGSQAGSGYSGGQSQIGAEYAFNVGNLGQDFLEGNKMFDLTNQLDQDKIKMAQAQQSAASGNMWMSIGGAAMNSAGSLAKMAMLF